MKNDRLIFRLWKKAPQIGCAAAAIFGCCKLQSATVTGRIADATGKPAITNVIFIPLSTPSASGGRVIYSTTAVVETDTNGAFSIALEPGDYRATIGTNAKDSFVLSVPLDNSTNDWLTLISGRLTYSFPYSPVYEEKRLRGATNGYAQLDETGQVPIEQVGRGNVGTNYFLRGTGYWSVILPQDIGSGIISADEYYSLDGVQSPIQAQLDRRARDLDGYATNLFLQNPVISQTYRLIAAEKPAQLLDGETWYDSSQRCRMLYQSGLVQAIETAIFVSTNTFTYTNNIVETEIIPAGIGSRVLPGNFLTSGKCISIRMHGIYSSPGVSATLTLRFKIGDSVFTTPAFGYSTSQANKFIYIDYQLICVAAGTNGSYIASGRFGSQTFTYGFSSATNPQNQTILIDTTRDNTISVTATHSRTDASLTVNQCIIQTIY
ncbi:MAG: hypothetical protein ACP5MG_13320 [Verrucomicrobiia bacterium]|jgi:hypothetical protein